ncbi:HMCN1-like protein [Mya arenaria]|uniref:HMCN1-like protein n=1 Tax=Mya arenaria TaxID=6604 RepID=A0ABY7F031_MYAAR|nr:HMCN1-like protein [Mya arenaria]
MAKSQRQVGAALDGNWGEWQAWQGCSATCGTGSMRRYRNCDDPAPDFGGSPCEGDSFEQQECSSGALVIHFGVLPVVVDGNWGEWSASGACSATCGDGRSVRTRDCDNPAPSNGGALCYGDAIVVSTCVVQECNASSDADDSGYGDGYLNVRYIHLYVLFTHACMRSRPDFC